ncbi:uncharacterized protein [Epargyreus clarus]|uniref:uncharacterized protein isoform X1 n=1 Tax=Epargyreus clarus TaxID=520877 RepID=UPI003C2F8AFA
MNRIRGMWRLVILAFTTSVYAQQNSRRPEPYDNGHGWDIRLAVPGQPGDDYPVLNSIPRTQFSCSGKSPGYYSDVDTGCQVFRVCTLGATYGFQSFLCPNGTLFNQEVLVCDWWMNVNCERSPQRYNDNSEKFGNLKLGPQLMNDIKKMLTHPMRYPYDKGMMKSNLIVMQDYKPPSGQLLFPNGALIAGPERSPNNIYVPSKQRPANFAQNSFLSGDLSFAASTPSSQYIPSSSNSIRPTERNTVVLQQQRQNLQLAQNGQTGTLYNNQRVQPTYPTNTEFINNNNNNRILPSPYFQNQNQNQRHIQQSQSTSQTLLNNQAQRELSQYNNQIIKKQHEYGISNTNQQYTNFPKHNGQAVEKNNIPQFSRDVNGFVGRAAKQNLVSSHIIPPTGKTLKFSRIVQKSSSGNPKSRITFKTWIVRPAKTARLVVEPTPYIYDKPTNDPTERNLVDITSNNINPKTENINPESEEVPYVYNKPTASSKQIITTVEDTPIVYLPPTAPTLPNLPFSTLKTPQSSRQSNLYLAATTYKPASRFYVPPTQNTLELSRQYLRPNLPSQENYQSARLVATPTSPAFDLTTINSNSKKSQSNSLSKKSHINTNHHNPTFSDILTKEKLDITVNDIVKDTNKILKTASPGELNQYRQYNEAARNQPNNKLSSEFGNVNVKKITAQSPTNIVRSEKIIAAPSSDLEPPIYTSKSHYENSNKLTNLPFFKESAVPKNTFERTVSLKITIPETIAEYLFNNQNDNDSDNLEILNTDNTNYLVLRNNHLDDNNNGPNYIPIGRLIWNKNINISNSQALVYSFLADSINAAKKYNNIVKETVVSPTPIQAQNPNLNDEDIGDITAKISQLTSSQFTNNNQKNANYVLPPRQTTGNDYGRDVTKYTTDHSQRQYPQNHHLNSQLSLQNTPDQLYSSRLQRLSSNNLVQNGQKTQNQIYSGQLYKLPVPEVTRQIYNIPNHIQASNARLTNELGTRYSLRDANQNDNANNIIKQSNNDIQIVQSESLPNPPTTQQLPRSDESTFNTQDISGNIYAENFLDTDTGITTQVQDKIIGTLPHPLEENKLVTYEKNKSYYLYTKLEDDSNDNIHNTNTIVQSNDHNNQQNAKFIQGNDLTNRITFELFPSIGYELQNEREKQQILNALKVTDISNSKHNGRTESFNKRQGELVTGVDFTILHPTSKKQVGQYNNANTILYRGPSSYLAPQSSVGSLGGNQQLKSITNSNIEQLEDNNNNGYSKTVPARQFSF